ncbi:MAG: 6-phosphofructokinase [Clostridia bacterium]|nr:6-phosphofructokinase [Clostridia bacterium]
MKTIGVLTSGGDAPGMNAAIRSVVRTAKYYDLKVLGVQRGYNGLINGEMKELNLSSVADILHKGGTILRTARCEEFKTEKGQERAAGVIDVLKMDGLVVIGGDGSFQGAEALSNRGIPTVGIPGTIDNDIDCTDYSIGFDTAVNTAIDAINKIRDTATSHERVNIIEVMGRNAGDIALYSGVAGGAESILVPEVEFNIENVCKKIIEGKNRGKLHSIVVLAEGAGDALDLCREIQVLTGIDTRATILGYIQRGGSPSAYDRILASKMGAKAVELLVQGKGKRVVATVKGDIVDFDIQEALAMKREFSMDLYELADILSQ